MKAFSIRISVTRCFRVGKISQKLCAKPVDQRKEFNPSSKFWSLFSSLEPQIRDEGRTFSRYYSLSITHNFFCQQISHNSSAIIRLLHVTVRTNNLAWIWSVSVFTSVLPLKEFYKRI